MALHQPSPLIPEISSTFMATLKRSASLSVNLFHHSASRKQLNVHWINLYNFFTSCAILIYCFSQYESRSDLVAVPHDEVVEMLARCQETLPLFRGAGASLVRRYERMLGEMIQVFELQQQHQEASADQGISLLTHVNLPSDQSQPNQNQASGFDSNLMTNNLFHEGHSPNMDPPPSFVQVGMSSEPANYMLPAMWADMTGQSAWGSTVQTRSDMEIVGNSGSV